MRCVCVSVCVFVCVCLCLFLFVFVFVFVLQGELDVGSLYACGLLGDEDAAEECRLVDQSLEEEEESLARIPVSWKGVRVGLPNEPEAVVGTQIGRGSYKTVYQGVYKGQKVSVYTNGLCVCSTLSCCAHAVDKWLLLFFFNLCCCCCAICRLQLLSCKTATKNHLMMWCCRTSKPRLDIGIESEKWRYLARHALVLISNSQGDSELNIFSFASSDCWSPCLQRVHAVKQVHSKCVFVINCLLLFVALRMNDFFLPQHREEEEVKSTDIPAVNQELVDLRLKLAQSERQLRSVNEEKHLISKQVLLLVKTSKFPVCRWPLFYFVPNQISWKFWNRSSQKFVMNLWIDLQSETICLSNLKMTLIPFATNEMRSSQQWMPHLLEYCCSWKVFWLFCLWPNQVDELRCDLQQEIITKQDVKLECDKLQMRLKQANTSIQTLSNDITRTWSTMFWHN